MDFVVFGAVYGFLLWLAILSKRAGYIDAAHFYFTVMMAACGVYVIGLMVWLLVLVFNPVHEVQKVNLIVEPTTTEEKHE